jgi:hypothetical protein
MSQPLIAPPAQDFLQKTLGAQLLAATTASATLSDTTGIQDLPGVFIVDRVDANGNPTPSKREIVSFQSTSGATVVTLARGLAGSSASDHAVGAIVEFSPDIVWAQAVYDGLSQILTPSTGVIDATKVLTPTNTATVSNKDLRSATNIFPASIPTLVKTPFTSLVDGATMYLDFSANNKFTDTIVPTGQRTFLATNATLGDVAMLRLNYASTASFSLILLAGAGATISWPGRTTPTPTATQGSPDLFGFVCVDPTIPRFDGVVMGQGF